MNDERYDRQQRLAEVGPHGQASIERSEARIANGPHANVELAYLVRAGVQRASIARAAPLGFAHAAYFHFTGPLAVAKGAHGALTHLRIALKLP